MLVSLGEMINEARILGGPQPTSTQTQGPSLEYEIGLCRSSPGERATDDPTNPALSAVTKQHTKAMPDPGLAYTGWLYGSAAW